MPDEDADGHSGNGVYILSEPDKREQSGEGKKVPMELLLVVIILILIFGGGFSFYRR